jgi:O-antigen ligase
MTTGILGGIPFVVLVLISISKCYKFIKERHGASWILLLFLQLIVFGNFSTGLYTSQDFWILLFFVLSMGKIAKPEVKLEPQKPERQKPAPVLVEEQ